MWTGGPTARARFFMFESLEQDDDAGLVEHAGAAIPALDAQRRLAGPDCTFQKNDGLAPQTRARRGAVRVGPSYTGAPTQTDDRFHEPAGVLARAAEGRSLFLEEAAKIAATDHPVLLVGRRASGFVLVAEGTQSLIPLDATPGERISHREVSNEAK